MKIFDALIIASQQAHEKLLNERHDIEGIHKALLRAQRACCLLMGSLNMEIGGDWNAVSGALRDCRRVTHAFLNAMDEAAPMRDEAFDVSIHARMRRVLDVRQDQLERLEAFHAGVGERLQTLSRWKVFAQSIGAKRARTPSVGLDSTR